MMRTKQKKIVYISAVVILLIIVSVSMVYVRAGNTAPEFKQRPPVIFDHDTHMGEYECLQCHHRYEDGENVLEEDELTDIEPDELITLNVMPEEELSGIKCASCHNYKKEKSTLNSMEAFHGQCIGCHEEKASGPVLCGECHILSTKTSDDE